MKLHLTSAENNYLITACGTQFVEVNKQQFTSSLLVMPQQLINDWGVANFAELNDLENDLADLDFSSLGLDDLPNFQHRQVILPK